MRLIVDRKSYFQARAAFERMYLSPTKDQDDGKFVELPLSVLASK